MFFVSEATKLSVMSQLLVQRQFVGRADNLVPRANRRSEERTNSEEPFGRVNKNYCIGLGPKESGFVLIVSMRLSPIKMLIHNITRPRE